MSKKWLKRLLIGLLLLYCIAAVARIAIKTKDYQWDFSIFYYSSKIFASGLNPYDLNALSSVAPNTSLPYANLPASLWFFLPFTLVNYQVASYLFLFLKCILLIGLIYLWKKEFLKGQTGIFFYLFCLLAFNNAIYIDIEVGNISILEQFLIWLGFYFYLKRRPLLFCAFILMAASFKIIPVLFLGLLWFLEDKKKYRYFFGSAFVFLSYLLIQYITTPYLFKGWVSYVLSLLGEGGMTNANTFGLVKDLLVSLSDAHPVSALLSSGKAKLILFFAAVIPILTTIIIVSRQAYRRLTALKIKDKEKILLFFSCLTYALLVPRFKDYSYILLLVPTYFIIRRVSYIKAYPVLFIFAILSFSMRLPLLDTVSSVLGQDYPIIAAYGAWGLYLYEIFVLGKQMQTKS